MAGPRHTKITNEEFKELRIRFKLTQKELANILDRSVRTVRNYETGSTDIDACVSLAMSYIKHCRSTHYPAN